MPILFKDIERKQNSDVNQGPLLRSKCAKNPNLDLVNINANTKFCKILSVCSQDIEQKQNYKRNSDIKYKCWKNDA